MKSLLELTQDILNEMDSDEVNSIGDTIESLQVANIIKSCYLEMMSNRDWPHLKKLGQLEPSNNTTLPSHMVLPANTKEMLFFRYDKRKVAVGRAEYGDVKYLYPDEFLRYTSNRDNTLDNVTTVIDPSGVELFILNDTAPTYWTSFDDLNLVCDAYNKNLDDTLKKSKSQAHYVLMPTFVMEDTAIPFLPAEAFAALQEEAKSTAFIALKQMANEKVENKAQRQQRWLSRKAWRAKGGVRYDNYGRTPRK